MSVAMWHAELAQSPTPPSIAIWCGRIPPPSVYSALLGTPPHARCHKGSPLVLHHAMHEIERCGDRQLELCATYNSLARSSEWTRIRSGE
ncbi:MAG: hypothetical protein KME57_03685 [Scytonema hyalinum WJT4-NPBG1]|nr:hypothetical protein [Scytonema hyalinum WJT4-NPBG1]